MAIIKRFQHGFKDITSHYTKDKMYDVYFGDSKYFRIKNKKKVDAFISEVRRKLNWIIYRLIQILQFIESKTYVDWYKDKRTSIKNDEIEYIKTQFDNIKKQAHSMNYNVFIMAKLNNLYFEISKVLSKMIETNKAENKDSMELKTKRDELESIKHELDTLHINTEKDEKHI